MAAAKPIRKMRFNHFKVFSGNANAVLAGEICYELGCQLAAANVKQFSDGEVHLQIQENVRGADVFVVQPTCTPVDHLFAAPVMVDYFSELGGEGLTVVSPDAGGVERARAFAKRMDSPLAIIDKRRTDVNVAEVMHIIGDVSGQHCLIVDDLIDT